MITNNITNALLGSIEHTTPQVAPENVEAYLATIEKAQRDLEKIDPSIALLDKQPVDSEVLAMVAAHQKQVVQSMVSSNPEDAIALALASSIEAYSQQLEIIYGWTNGGVEMFESALWLMLEGIEEGGVQPEELEDLFQIALLEIMIHPEKYGLENWYAANKEDISHILESTGSGSHGLHESDYDTPEELAEVTKSLYEGIMNNATIPEGSLLDEVMSALEDAGGSDALYSQINDNYYDDYGWWTEGTADDLSPMLRLFLLSEVLSNNPKMSQEDVELILTGSLTEIDDLIKKTFGSNSALEFLCANTTWQIQTGYTYPDGKTTQIDWKGDGIDNSDLVDLYTNFKPRDLTDEDIEEINRIGDQVKMLQQTLKYWLQICRDEQMAIARNI
ncbi:hypothetical protein GTG28_06725 [Vibrio sp. OCN044]|uniref:Uncharacterized protein n=1 Tax=Vibrio tetraodonis subsp. pristinus TaxID=2695891 RepID=A0A6L8LTU0_9VIBR|nr:hypothetical protein [Vibrio tetraodonis]MYM58913.1 hypothetical protein [Vibrio tetraodonis subsp. pristinus]